MYEHWWRGGCWCRLSLHGKVGWKALKCMMQIQVMAHGARGGSAIAQARLDLWGGGRKLRKHGHLKCSELFCWFIINQACAYALDRNAAMSSKIFLSESNKVLIISKICKPVLASNHYLGVRQSSRTGKRMYLSSVRLLSSSNWYAKYNWEGESNVKTLIAKFRETVVGSAAEIICCGCHPVVYVLLQKWYKTRYVKCDLSNNEKPQ